MALRPRPDGLPGVSRLFTDRVRPGAPGTGTWPGAVEQGRAGYHGGHEYWPGSLRGADRLGLLVAASMRYRPGMDPSDETPYPEGQCGLRVQAAPGGTVCLFEIVDRRGRALAHVALEAPELDSLVRLLADLRAGLGDPVPASLDAGARLVALVDPAWQARLPSSPDAPEGVTLALRHPGLGWLGFLLPPREAAVLGQSLVQLAAARSGPAPAPAAVPLTPPHA
jgi:hypothetical protein